METFKIPFGPHHAQYHPMSAIIPPRRIARASCRVRMNTNATVLGRLVQKGRCLDLSTGGVGLHLQNPPRVGELLRLTISLPRSGRIDARAEVVHTDNQRVGARFVELDQNALANIHRWITVDA